MFDKLRLQYSELADSVMRCIDELADRHELVHSHDPRALWNQQRSVVLITYPDRISATEHSSLEAQRRFVLDYGLDSLIMAIHVLPFFSSSSDDGFSVVDYRRVDPAYGDWSDIHRLGKSFDLVFDFGQSCCSRSHYWCRRFRQCEQPYVNYFIDVDPATDLSAVTRLQSSPLLTPCETNRGTEHVWTTFSADRVDLNFQCPQVLFEALDILLLYIGQGARVIRLNAIGFSWKRIGTTCMHLPETHTVVSLIRDLVDELAPRTVLLTETNVPHQENVSYFGEGSEAHVVYQFSLALATAGRVPDRRRRSRQRVVVRAGIPGRRHDLPELYGVTRRHRRLAAGRTCAPAAA